MRRSSDNLFVGERAQVLVRWHSLCPLLLSVCCLWGCATSSPKEWNRITSNRSKVSARIDTPAEKKSLRDYDAVFVKAIEKKWNDLIEEKPSPKIIGVVVVEFKLLPDGFISGVLVTQNTAGEEAALICRKAILESGPHAAWPEEMRRDLGLESREIKFTFNYLK